MRIRAARVGLGMTQRELADGVWSASTVSRFELGVRRPDVAALELLAARLELSVEELVCGGVVDRRGAMEVRLTHAGLALTAGELGNARRYAEQVVRVTRWGAECDLAWQGLLVLALVLEAEGEYGDAIVGLEELRGLVVGDGELLGAVGVALSRCYRESGRLGRAVAVAEEVGGELRGRGLEGSYEYVMLIVGLAAAWYEKGDLNQAIRLCARGLVAAEVSGSTRGRAAACWMASAPEYDVGNIDEALELTSRALESLEVEGSNESVALLRSQLASYYTESPAPDLSKARALFELAGRELEWSLASPVELARNFLGQARASLAGGDSSLASMFLGRISPSAEAQIPYFRAAKALLRGHIRAADGGVESASRSYGEARYLLARLDRNRDAAQLWFELAEGWTAIDHFDEALDSYRMSSAILGGEKPRRPASSFPTAAPG
ncbi:MAG: helix-turn-helix domain-containing protein [Nocardioides sp.]